MALLLVAALALVGFAVHGWRAISFPYPLDYGEGPLLDQSVRLADFQNLYDPDLSEPPYTVTNYTPLYMLAQLPWVRAFGPSYAYGRLLSWLCGLASALTIGLIVHAWTRDRLASVASAATFLAIPYVGYWASLFRIDMLALALSLTAMLTVVRRPEGRGALIVTALLLTAAVYTRQTYGLAAPLACFVWLARGTGGLRHALRLAALVAGVGLVVFVGLNVRTNGGFFFHVVSANVNRFDGRLLLLYAGELALRLPVLWIFAAAFLWLGRQGRSRRWLTLAVYAAGGAAVAATIGKTGSNVNYLLELSAALCLAAGWLLAELRRRPALCLAATLVLTLQIAWLLGGSPYQRHLQGRMELRPELDKLYELVQRREGPLLADEALGLLPLDGQPVSLQPFEMTQLARAGRWDPAPFLAALERREFSAILIYRPPGSLLHRTRWSDEMLEGIQRSYVPVESHGFSVVYRPRSTESPR